MNNKFNIHLPSISRNMAIMLAVLWVMIIGLGIYIGLYAPTILEKHSSVQELETTVLDLQNQASILKKNNTLSDAEIDQFNEVTTKLVPSEESYFSLINALEELSQKSGFVLSDYNIDLNLIEQNKIAITVKGNGSIDSFLKFLEDYNFGGGRLITVDEFDVPLDNQESYSLVLNFYHERQAPAETETKNNSNLNIVPQVQGAAPKLTDKDVTFIRDVLQKTSE